MNGERGSTLFLHIPKTAGTSLKRFLAQYVHVQDMLLDPPSLDGIELDRFALVAGHLDYDAAARYRTRPFVMTCLRDPIERALSAYWYQRTPRLALEIRSTASSIGAERVEQILADLERVNRHATLHDFLHCEPELARSTLGNVQTAFLAGAEAVAAHGNDPNALSAIAFEHLDACEGILLAERLPETLGLIDPAWGERSRFLRRDNITPDRGAASELTPEELGALAELTALDALLYRHATDLVEQCRTPAALPPLHSGPPADAVNFGFDQPIHGTGWHGRERAGETWFCWSEQIAVLTLHLRTRGDHLFDCTVEHASCAQAWNGLVISVDGRELTLSKPATAPGHVTAHVPSAWLESPSGNVTIGFRTIQTLRPSDADPANPDTRALGVAVSRVSLVEIGAETGGA